MDEFVSRKEFDLLKQEVNEIKAELKSNADLLISIDKKIDIISEKVTTSEKTNNLIINPIEERVKKIESSNTWLWRTIAGAIITIVVKIIFDMNH